GRARLDTAVHEPAHPLAQPGDAEDARGASFQAVRELLRLDGPGRIAAGPPLAPRPHPGPLADGETAGSGRAEESLVPGERQEVDGVRLHVDRHDAGALRRIDQEQGVALARRPPDGRARL